VLALSLGIGALPPSPRTAAQADGAAALDEFHARVAAYMRVRDQISRTLPPERIFDDAREMLAARHTLRQALRDARKDARRGDVFTPAAASALRQTIAGALADHRVEPEDLRRQMNAERDPDAKAPVVNGRYDWRLGAWMWAALLHELPTLPSGLEYRIVDGDLVLVDVGASLVVDILDHALTPAEE
jgi:hypothetical protein